MNLVEIHKFLKRNNKNCVIFMKYGNFFRVFDKDTYIIWYYTEYKINNERVGFPINVIDKVKDILISNDISLIIYNNGSYIKVDSINNKYEYIYKLARDKYEKIELLNILKDYDCLDKLRDFVDGIKSN